jgi:hypothetical protein
MASTPYTRFIFTASLLAIAVVGSSGRRDLKTKKGKKSTKATNPPPIVIDDMLSPFDIDYPTTCANLNLRYFGMPSRRNQ